MNIKWEPQTGKYQNGEWARVGKVVVGSVFYSGTVSRDDPRKYAVNCMLPGIKQTADRYTTIDDAKCRLERMVEAWFSWVAA